MSVDLTKLNFFSGVNYLKRDTALVGTTLLTLPAADNVVSHTVTHSLGYIPFVYVGADVDNDGIIWSNQKVHTYTDTVLSGLTSTDIEQILLTHSVSTTQLVINLENLTTTEAGEQRRIYWVIYLDYGNA